MVSQERSIVHHPSNDSSEVLVDAARHSVVVRLMDSLLHDVRNPLNAMSINLEVLGERLKREGAVSAATEKNLKSMRDQVTRMDGLLRLFAEFMAPGNVSGLNLGMSELVTRAVEMLGHEGRRRRVTLNPQVQAGLRVVKPSHPQAVFLVTQTLLRGIARSPEGEAVTVTLSEEAGRVVLKVTDRGAWDVEPFCEAIPAIQTICRDVGAELKVQGGEFSIAFGAA